VRKKTGNASGMGESSKTLGGNKLKNHPWGRYGYFLEPHNINRVLVLHNRRLHYKYEPKQETCLHHNKVSTLSRGLLSGDMS